jgi:hypothetical protein
MHMNQKARYGMIATALIGLSACGGGGSDSGSAAAPATQPPASGNYAWVLKAQGPTDALKYGLSLLHPSTPGTEWIVEVSSAMVSDAKLVSAGNIDAAGLKASGLRPYALVYIVGGDVRRVPLEANGTSPVSRVQRAQSSSACAFEIDANDLSAPENSRYIVTTAGADGACNTADDGRAEVKLGSTGGLTFTPIGGDAPLGVFRDTTTLTPRGWIYPKGVSYWSAGTTVTTRTSTEPAFTSLVASTYRAALLDDGTQLSMLDLPAGNAPIETRLDAITTGGGGWCGIGFDAANIYVYRNTVGAVSLACGDKPTPATWTVLKISRTVPRATVMAQGAGFVSVASMARTQLYATVIGTSNNTLVAISKTPGVALRSDTMPSTTLATVQTSASDVHQLWRVTNIGTAAIAYSIEMIDETGGTLYSTSAGGFPMAVADASAEDFNSSESRTRFVFANGYSTRAVSGASIVSYDAATRSATTFGALPGSTEFGTDFVFASSMGGPSNFMTGFVARSTGGAIQAAGAKVFSFNASKADSLKYTTELQ